MDINTKEVIKDTASQIIESLREFNQLDNCNRKERRKLKQALQKFIRKNKFDLLEDESDVKEFIVNVFDGVSTLTKDGVKVTVKFFREQKNNKLLNTQPRSYQREKVASYDWKCEIIKTLIIDKKYPIPPIHVRIIRDNKNQIIGFEIADGQQRLTAILDFMDGKFSLPSVGLEAPPYGKFKGISYSEMLVQFPNDAEKIKNYGLSVVFYDNFSDEDIATLFIKILNNVNDLNVQEKNNATRSRLADFVRYTSRNGNGEWLDTSDMFHKLFSRTTTNEGTDKQKTEWDYFNNMGIGRMEGDQWLASLIYLYLSGWKSGVTPTNLFKFYEATSQQAGHDIGWNFKDKLSTSQFPNLEADIVKLLDITHKFTEWVIKNKNKSYLKPNFLLFVILFVDEYMNRVNVSKGVDWDKFSKKMIGVVDKWNNPKVYEMDNRGNIRYQSNGKTALGAFKGLWGSLNTNVISTALSIVKEEMDLDPDWGFVEIDPRVSFSDSAIEKRWNEVGRVCEYTGEPITLEDVVGDHAIPRSWGIKLGGVTEYHNLRVTTAYHNGRKLQMNEEAYRAKLEQEGKVI